MFNYFIVIVFLLCTSLKAQQTNKPGAILHYVFDTFQAGKVQMKSGELFERRLNYNTITGEMIFEDKGKYLAIKEPQKVDTVFIAGRKFIPEDNVFYELILKAAYPLFQQFTGKLVEPGASVGYGNASATTNAVSINLLRRNGQAYEMKLPDDYQVVPESTFWIVKNRKYQKVSNAKQLIAVFPEKREWITEFIKTNKTDFLNRSDVLLIVKQLQ
ncbi:MAG TPA: hypothetical protein VL946_10965 [Lacibacter sp.]|nr:hypothetical protein [Lacibacter sp.]